AAAMPAAGASSAQSFAAAASAAMNLPPRLVSVPRSWEEQQQQPARLTPQRGLRPGPMLAAPSAALRRQPSPDGQEAVLETISVSPVRRSLQPAAAAAAAAAASAAGGHRQPVTSGSTTWAPSSCPSSPMRPAMMAAQSFP
ncbi:unnamed protein product, partial [Polarella glacialis]